MSPDYTRHTCCSQERPHLVVPQDDQPHWVARRAKRGDSGVIAWERTPEEEWTDEA